MSRNRITAGPKSVICHETDLQGEISIGWNDEHDGKKEKKNKIMLISEFTGTVLHPQCKIIAENGPIYIGKNNIVEENVVIFNRNSSPLVIGDENVFEVGCYVEGQQIGNNNVIEARARVLGSTTIGDHCIIGAACATEVNETIADMTVIYGSKSSRRQQSEVFPTQAALHARHLDYLREVLPKYNHLHRTDQ
ncbi:trimeric LpxA-like protein [Fennellomyces sp. T-0311]|nr:trimeric LpxA-like protein [Fennellomyces sp. T-0311]